jgi:hypothetical protein
MWKMSAFGVHSSEAECGIFEFAGDTYNFGLIYWHATPFLQ